MSWNEAKEWKMKTCIFVSVLECC